MVVLPNALEKDSHLEISKARSDEFDEEKQQDVIRGLNAEVNTLEDRIWLRKCYLFTERSSWRQSRVEHLGVR